MDATEYLLSSPANRVRLLRSMGYREPATTDDPHRILYDGEGDWLLETETHVGDDVS